MEVLEEQEITKLGYGPNCTSDMFMSTTYALYERGVVHEKGLLAQDLPPWLTRITGKISDKSRLFPSAINHVLINEYLPKQGIMPHQDGPAYFPVVAILSLGSPVVMDFTPHSSLGECRHVEDGIKLDERLDDERPFSVVLMPRSLLIFKDKAYSDYLHGIRDCEMQYYDRAVNATETSKHDAGNQWRPGLEKSNEVRAEDINSFCRTTTRVSLTCRVVSKM
ncbi:hypothetical protein RJ639_019860 [Escallonia herrerae]|uniref:Fe2OG dioxygenase domain-containing protein n=1 Tax=Escallonia herrerae TaxID=1293975 RepID=A0AA89AI93_9ASTE|nr:hypothetical protein RJ639_019860 [Escallonia herrerae]